MEKTIDDKIKILQTKIVVEKEPTAKQNLEKQMLVLRLRKQIEQLQKRIEQIN